MKIYLASSWRNQAQQPTVEKLRLAGHEVYDFKNPNGGTGFQWSQIDQKWQDWTPTQYKASLSHEIAVAGFKSDWDAMNWADCGVLLLPSGRSAHIEAGYFVGANKPLHIILSEKDEPELMYKMATSVNLTVADAIHEIAGQSSFATNEPKKIIKYG